MTTDQRPLRPTARTLGIGLIIVAGLTTLAIATAGPPRSRSSPGASTAGSAVEAASSLRDTHPTGEWADWREADGPQTFRLAGHQLQVSAARDSDGAAVATARIRAPDGETMTYRTGPGSWANLSVAADRLQAGDPTVQILISSFSGGAHCCSDLTVIERRDGRWKRIDFGQRDGDTPELPRDRDGDGRKEFQFADQTFLYAFDSYAGSWAPPIFKQLDEGRIVDVSREPSMRFEYEAYAQRAEPACREGGNGACAGYVAAAARTGRLETAWAIMLDSYDQASAWELPRACRVRTTSPCPAGASLTFATYPEALHWFLGEHGYAPRTYVEPVQATGPSYDCGAARSPGETAVCRSADLAMQDRMLAIAYNRAVALSDHRGALRQSQRRFVSTRNAETDTTALARLYDDRIDLLLSVE